MIMTNLQNSLDLVEGVGALEDRLAQKHFTKKDKHRHRHRERQRQRQR
jgi:hypothetical protein